MSASQYYIVLEGEGYSNPTLTVIMWGVLGMVCLITVFGFIQGIKNK